MHSVKMCDYDCTRKCQYREHGNRITMALTKRSISDEDMAAFIAKTCANFYDILDDWGRSAIHMAASVGRYAVLEWLLNQGGIINGRDYESGSTPLHRAIYYGSIDCAVLLLRWGASLELQDDDTYCALQSVCKLRDMTYAVQIPEKNEILVWGSNKNNNLGISSDQAANIPQALNFFRKEHISIAAVALGAYHSLFLDKRSYLYAVGHGKGGRLGTGNEKSLPSPQKIKIPIKNNDDEIISISVSLKHSLVLTNRSLVFASGLNEDQQLGVRDAGEKLTVFREVITLRDIGVEGLKKVIARDQYSIAYSEKYVFVWGTNVGQFAMDENVKTVPLPKMLKLPARTSIDFVEANNAALVVYTKDGLILLYYNYKTKSLKPPNFEALKSIAVVGGDANKTTKGTATALKLLMLTQTNVIFLWYEMTQTFIRCSLSQIRLSQIDKIFYKANQVIVLSQGDVYKGKCQQVAVPVFTQNEHNKQHQRNNGELWCSSDKNITEISKEHMIRIELQRIPNVDRAVDIFCNDDFSSFAALQESFIKYFKLPTLTAEEYTFKKLYHESSEYDAVHDVVFHVDDDTFAAHKFIVLSRAPGLRDIINMYVDKHIYLNSENLTGKMFEIILKFTYTNYLPTENDLDEIKQSLGDESPLKRSEICILFLSFVEKFQLVALGNYLKSFLAKQPFCLPQIPDKSKFRFNRLRRHNLPELYDVRILCTDNVELAAHKCILVARLEYFEMMFTHTWAEQTTINLSTVPIEYMGPIVEFLYSSDVEHFRKQNYTETFLYNMIVYCDQFFIERLRKVCEIQILDKITIRKCGEMLDFATMYNCDVLKRGCLEFICQNLARVLRFGCLETCEPESLVGINAHYRNMFKDVFDYRMILPHAEAIEDELLLSFIDGFKIDLHLRVNEMKEVSTGTKLKQRENMVRKDLRQYERDAITSMMESISLNESTVPAVQNKKVINETAEIPDKLQPETKVWNKVVDKKEQKRKTFIESSVKVNDLLLQDEKPKPQFVSLNEVVEKQSPEKNVNTAVELTSPATPPAKAFNINLTDFTLSREKLSQKQRKRLSAENTPISSWRSPTQTTSTSATIEPASVPNAWGIVPADSSPSTNLSFDEQIEPTGSASDPTSFANMARASQKRERTTSVGIVSPGTSNSFSKILDEERRQRDYYTNLRNKSLALTQIEETAIAELREFYNADNATDEIITIERKPQPKPMNFAVWQRN